MTLLRVTKNARSGAAAGGGSALSHGSTYTITGTGFGSAPAVADFLQPSIESTSAGAAISLSAPWGQPDAAVPTFRGYDDATRGRVVRGEYNAADAFDVSLQWDRGSNAAANEYLYWSWWVRCVTLGPNVVAELDDGGGTTFPGGDGWQYKIWRFRFNNSVNDSFGSGDMLVSHWDNEDGSYITAGPGEGGPNDSFHYINGVGGSGGSSPPPPFVNNSSGRRAGGDDLPTLYRSHWFRCEVLFFTGSGATGACRMRVYHDNPGVWRHVANLQSIDWLGGGRAFRYFQIQNYLGNIDTPGGNFNGTQLAVDDFYASRMSSSIRRIELTNSASLSLSQWREIQDHASWSDSQVTGSLNAGASRNGTLYLHVVQTDITTGNDTSLGSAQVLVQ